MAVPPRTHLVDRRPIQTLILCFAIFGAAQVASADQMDDKTREHVMKAAGQVAMGKKVQGEDKIEVIGWGSGWFINRTGLMVTNDHVINPSHYSEDPTQAFRIRNDLGIIQYRVTLNGGTSEEKSYQAELMYNNESADLALLQVRDEDGGPLVTPEYLEMVPSAEVGKGDRVFVVGYPKGQQMATSKDKHAPVTISPGNVTDIELAPSGRIKKFRTDAQAAPGNSGGPGVNADGELLGVLVEGGADVGVATGVSGGLIPGDVVGDMIRAALGLNKIDTDLSYFLPLLVDGDHNVFIPGRPRIRGKDVIVFHDGAEMTGRILEKEVTLTTPLGKMTVPIEDIGYMLNNNGSAQLLLDGGERLVGKPDEIRCRFENERGQKPTLTLSNLRSIIMRRPDRDAASLPDIDALVIEGSDCRLYVKDPRGKVRFEDESQGTVELPLDRIRKVTNELYKQVVHKIDGSRLTGKFLPHTVQATLAIRDRPVELSLENLKRGHVRRGNPAAQQGEALPLQARLEIDDEELGQIARALEAGDVKKAGGLLDELIVPEVLKSKAKPIQEQIEVLHAEYALRQGDYENAIAEFRGLRRAKIEGVRSYALGRYHVLKIYPMGEYRGQQLSDPKVLDEAARRISETIVAEAREVMSSHGKAQITKFSDWNRLESKTRQMEDDLMIAASLTHGRAERTMFQMWRFRQDRNWAAIVMLQGEAQDLRSEIATRQTNRKPIDSLARKLDKVNRQIRTVLIKYRDLRNMMNPLGRGPGYRVDDPEASEFLP